MNPVIESMHRLKVCFHHMTYPTEDLLSFAIDL
jgi:hypothetical protein